MPTFLIVGASGQQGSAVVEALMSRGDKSIKISATTRDPASPKAQQLASRGLDIRRADRRDQAAIEEALQGCDGAYFMTNSQGPASIEGEVLQGKTFVDAAKAAAGVPHTVFSSVAGALEATKVRQFRTKFLVEEYIRGADIPHTIVRPTGFMNGIPPEDFGRSMFLSALPALVENAPLGYVACEDIGKVAGKSLLNLTQRGERIYTICGDVLIPRQLKAQLNSAEIVKTWTIWLPAFLVRLFVPRLFMEMFDFPAEGRQPGSVEDTKAIIPDVQGVAQRAIKQH